MDDEFKKTAMQIEAINTIGDSVSTNFCLFGGSRSSKSFTIMYIIFVRAARVKSDHLIVRETFSSAKASIWQKTMPDVLRLCFPELYPSFNKADLICTLPNGSTIKIAGLDDDKKLERLLGTEYSTLWFNESNQIPYTGVSRLKSRLAQLNDLKKMSYYDLNPTKTTSWVYQLFEEKIDPVEGEALEFPDDYESFRMNIQGNLVNVDPEYIKILERMNKKDKKRFYAGEYDTTNLGKAVYAFNKDEHVSLDAAKLRGTVYTGNDFNIMYNSDIIGSRTGMGEEGQLYIWAEVQIEGDTYKKCDELIKKGARGAIAICDSTGRNRSTSGLSNFKIMEEAGFIIAQTFNPYVIDKISNLNRCFTLGLIKINPKCRKLIRDLTQLEWRKEGELDQTRDPSLSHLVDCLAYMCWYFFPHERETNARIVIR